MFHPVSHYTSERYFKDLPMPVSQTANAPRRWLVFLAFFAIYILWGSSYLGIRFGLESFPPFLMMGFRFAVAGLILMVWAKFQGAPPPSRVEWRSTAITGIIMFSVGNGLLVWAQQHTPSGLTALIMALIPAWIVLLDWVRPGGVRPNSEVIIGVVMGFVGIALLINPDKLGGHQDVSLIGLVALVISGVCWAGGTLYARQSKQPQSPIMATGMQLFCGGVMLFLAGVVSGQVADFDPNAVSLRSIISLVHLIFSGSILGFTSYVWLLRVTSASQVATYAYINPVVAMILGWLFAGEMLTPRTVLAAMVIIAAVAVIITYRGEGRVRIGDWLRRKVVMVGNVIR
jgi:drug/metabolite transporter (DMT)-like permease